MRLEAGKIYIRRDGKEQTIDFVYPDGSGVGVINCQISAWEDGGLSYRHKEFDLISEKPALVEGWVNVYADGSLGSIRKSRAEADLFKEDRVLCVFVREGTP